MNKYSAMVVHNGFIATITFFALLITENLWSALILFFCVKTSKEDE